MDDIAVTKECRQAQTPLLDEVYARVKDSEVRVRIGFAVPVRYLRHFPTDRGELLKIFFRVITIDGAGLSMPEEVRRVRATASVPGFTVTYIHPPSPDIRLRPIRVPTSTLRGIAKVSAKGNTSASR